MEKTGEQMEKGRPADPWRASFTARERELEKVLREIQMDMDVLLLSASAEGKEEAKAYYGALGWRLVSEKRDFFHRNLYHLRLERDHFVPHKDELQFLEVKFEDNVARLNRIKRGKHRRSRMDFLLLGMGGLSTVLTAAVLAVHQAVPDYACWILFAFGGILFLVFLASFGAIFRSETKLFEQNYAALVRERERIFRDVEKVSKR